VPSAPNKTFSPNSERDAISPFSTRSKVGEWIVAAAEGHRAGFMNRRYNTPEDPGWRDNKIGGVGLLKGKLVARDTEELEEIGDKEEEEECQGEEVISTENEGGPVAVLGWREDERDLVLI
jgi:hypothetical protein